MKALAPDLKDRYTNCEELRHDLAKFLAQTSPGTDATRVAKFLSELYDEDIAAERAEREQLIVKAREWYTSKQRRPAAGAGDREDQGHRQRCRRQVGRQVRAPPAGDGALHSHPGRTRCGTSGSPSRTQEPRGSSSSESTSAGFNSAGSSSADSNSASDGSATVVGTVIGGRYYVRRLIGEGGMGRVFEAEHIDIGRRVALKILHPAYSQTPDLVERLRREARAASKISHPNVVDVTDSGTTPDGAFFFVMEYLEGIELGELIYREGKLDVARALHIGAQISPRHPGGARGERHSPRHQAGERPHPDPRRSEGLRQGARLRHRQERQGQRSREREGHQRRSAPEAHPSGDDDGDARVHGPRAGGRAAGRSPLRRLRRGRSGLRDALRQGALRGAELHGDPPQEGDHHAGAAVWGCATTSRPSWTPSSCGRWPGSPTTASARWTSSGAS